MIRRVHDTVSAGIPKVRTWHITLSAENELISNRTSWAHVSEKLRCHCLLNGLWCWLLNGDVKRYCHKKVYPGGYKLFPNKYFIGDFCFFLQGFFVALIFCFCNGEVISVLKRKWGQRQLMLGKPTRSSYSHTHVTVVDPPQVSSLPTYRQQNPLL